MLKNDYRRAFIMLRPSLSGFSGHVRLEKRTLTGNMYFVVAAPESAGPLEAVLAGQSGGAYYAAKAGALRRDRRGQATLAWTFNPRSIDGRPLDDYQWVVIARSDGTACQVALCGNVDGSYPLDARRLNDAVCALLAPPEPAFDLPERGPEAPEAPAAQAADEPEENAAPDDAETMVPKVDQVPTKVIRVPAPESRVSDPSRCEPLPEATADEATPPAEAALPNGETQAEDAALAEEAAREDGDGPSFDAPEVPPVPNAPSAASLLGLDTAQPWSLTLEALRPLFDGPAAEDPGLGDGFTYVAAPMPLESGCEHCLIGLRVNGGTVDAVRYCLPSRYTPEPPAGLEDYVWREAGNQGYWVLTVNPDNGAAMEG